MSLSAIERGGLGAVAGLVLLALALDIPARRPPAVREVAPPTPMALATAAADARQAAGRAEAAAEALRMAAVQAPAETEEALPAGHGRETVFGRCTACHATAIIRRSALSRDRWDELMDWMTEKHGMAPLEGTDRALVVDYLAEHFPPRRGRRNANPFLD